MFFYIDRVWLQYENRSLHKDSNFSSYLFRVKTITAHPIFIPSHIFRNLSMTILTQGNTMWENKHMQTRVLERQPRQPQPKNSKQCAGMIPPPYHPSHRGKGQARSDNPSKEPLNFLTNLLLTLILSPKTTTDVAPRSFKPSLPSTASCINNHKPNDSHANTAADGRLPA
jgi:hypothetical protein